MKSVCVAVGYATPRAMESAHDRVSGAKSARAACPCWTVNSAYVQYVLAGPEFF
jgi:hypothetical protein